MTCKPLKQLIIVFNSVRTMSNYVYRLQRSREILECLIVSGFAQYDLHHGTFLLVTSIVMSSDKSTIIQCESTSPRWHAVVSFV